MTPALKLDGVSLGYGSRRLVEDLSLEIPAGRCVALLGRNGAGKSTLLGTLAGIRRPLAGRVLVDGADVFSLPPLARGRRIAYLPQLVRAQIPFTVRDVVLMGRYPHQGPSLFASRRDCETVDRILHDAGLDELASKRCTELSGGELQRVLVASIISQQASVMLLDEPTASLDLVYRSSIMEMIGAIPDVTVVLATHDLNLAAAHSDWIVAIGPGGDVVSGSTAGVLDEDLVRDVFGVDVRLVEVDRPGGGILRQFVVVS